MGSYLRITEWAEEDRPREKLANKGRNALSDAELLAILIGSGTKSKSAVDLSKEILQSVNNDLNELATLSLNDLMKFDGIGEAKAIAIVSALEIGRRRKNATLNEKPRITRSSDAFEIMKPYLLDLQHEEFWLIAMNRANMVLSVLGVSQGGVTGTVIDPKKVFLMALERRAVNIILVHNHPSGNLKPSESDRSITKKMKEGGQLLEINVLDHIIFTNNGYFSFADEGLI